MNIINASRPHFWLYPSYPLIMLTIILFNLHLGPFLFAYSVIKRPPLAWEDFYYDPGLKT
jgi:hypothetical protein